MAQDLTLLGVGIDPTAAATGGDKLAAILNSLVTTADKLTQAVNRIGESAGTSVTKTVTEVAKIEPVTQKARGGVEKLANAGAGLSKLEKQLADGIREIRAIGEKSIEASGGVNKLERSITAMVAEFKTGFLQGARQEMIKLGHDGAMSARQLEKAAREAAKGFEEGIRLELKALRERDAAFRIGSTHMRQSSQETANWGRRLNESSNLLSAVSGLFGPLQGRVLALTNVINAASIATSAMGTSARGAGVGLGMIALALAPILILLGVFAAAVAAAKGAWDFFMGSLGSAGANQSAQIGLTNLIGSAASAKRIFGEINKLELETGVFDEAKLTLAARNLYAAGIGTDNLTTKLKELMAAAAADPSYNIEKIVDAYSRLRTLSAKGITSNQLVQFGREGIPILEMLALALRKTDAEINKMIAGKQIGLKEIDLAFKEAAKSGGLFGGTLAAAATSWVGTIGRIKSAWQEIKEVFGTPIINALAPMLEGLLPILTGVQGKAAAAGESIAQFLRAIDIISKERGVWVGLQVGWEIAITKMGNFAVEHLVNLFLKLGPALGNALGEGFVQQIRDTWGLNLTVGLLGGVDMKTFGKTLIQQLSADPNLIKVEGQTAGQIYAEAFARAAGPGSPDFIGPILPLREERRADRPPVALAEKSESSGARAIRTDIELLQEYRERLEEINTTAMTTAERMRRIREIQATAISGMADPSAHAAALTAEQSGLEKRLAMWRIAEAERRRIAQETDERIAAGQASVTESMLRGMQRAVDQLGSFSAQIAKLSEDITNSIANNLSGAIGDVITGTKDAKTAFKDFAVSVLNDIARMITKMLVMYAVQKLVGAVGGAAGGGTYGLAAGGPIIGPSHANGGVRFEAEGGEFMMRKDAVRNEGIESMAALNEGKAMIVRKFEQGGEVLKFAKGGETKVKKEGVSKSVPGFGWTSFLNPMRNSLGLPQIEPGGGVKQGGVKQSTTKQPIINQLPARPVATPAATPAQSSEVSIKAGKVSSASNVAVKDPQFIGFPADDDTMPGDSILRGTDKQYVPTVAPTPASSTVGEFTSSYRNGRTYIIDPATGETISIVKGRASAGVIQQAINEYNVYKNEGGSSSFEPDLPTSNPGAIIEVGGYNIPPVEISSDDFFRPYGPRLDEIGSRDTSAYHYPEWNPDVNALPTRPGSYGTLGSDYTSGASGASDFLGPRADEIGSNEFIGPSAEGIDKESFQPNVGGTDIANFGGGNQGGNIINFGGGYNRNNLEGFGGNMSLGRDLSSFFRHIPNVGGSVSGGRVIVGNTVYDSPGSTVVQATPWANPNDTPAQRAATTEAAAAEETARLKARNDAAGVPHLPGGPTAGGAFSGFQTDPWFTDQRNAYGAGVGMGGVTSAGAAGGRWGMPAGLTSAQQTSYSNAQSNMVHSMSSSMTSANTMSVGDAGRSSFNLGQGAKFRGQVIDGVVTAVPYTPPSNPGALQAYNSAWASWAASQGMGTHASTVKAFNDRIISGSLVVPQSLARSSAGPSVSLPVTSPITSPVSSPIPPSADSIMQPAISPSVTSSAGITKTQYYQPSPISPVVPEFHKGGIIGQEGKDSYIFAGGGEVPFSGMSGEGVFTPGQMANLAPVGGGAQYNTFSFTTIVQPSGETSTTSEGSGTESAKETGDMINRRLKSAIADETREGGIISNFVRSRKG